MKFTIQELKDIINEELESILEQSDIEDHDGDGETGTGFPSDVPFIEYEEAKDETEAGILPQLRQAADNRPVYFMTKIRDNEYPSVYTKYKPGIDDARRYEKMGVKLIWADSRYGIGNWSPKSIIGIHKTNRRMRRDAEIYGNYHYLPENIDEIIDEELESVTEGSRPMAYFNQSMQDRVELQYGGKRIDFMYRYGGRYGDKIKAAIQSLANKEGRTIGSINGLAEGILAALEQKFKSASDMPTLEQVKSMPVYFG